MRISTSRSIAFVLGIALVVGTSGFLLQAEPPQEVGTWASIGTSDPQATRTGAAVATLPDRTTLVAGGLTAEGAATDSIVIHDPLTNASTTVGQLLVPRVDAAATRLDDGRILITGGQVGSLISSDVEIFDPATGESTFAALLQRPRTGHASALLADGTVLIVGGTTDDGAVLATTERFDPSTNSVSAAEPMAVARTGASATTLIDGRVLVAGGHDGAQDLKSAEIYSPVDGEFLSVPTLMSEARSGHTALLLPHNNSVLIAGGTSADSAVTTTDLFLPTMFPDPYSWGMGTFGPTDPEELARMTMVQPRSRAVAGPWGDDGYAFAMGGGSGDGEVYRFATIKTDKDDYAPGELAVITGSGWEPLEEVTLTFQEDPAVHDDYVLTLTADDEGNVYHDQWAPDWHDLGVRFYLMAVGSQSRAQATFTDGGVTAATVTIKNPSGAVCGTANSTFSVGDAVCGTFAVTVAGPGNTNFRLHWYSPGTLALGQNPVRSTSANINTVGGSASFDDILPAALNTTIGTWDVLVCNNTNNQSCVSAQRFGAVTFVVTATAVATTTSVVSSMNPSIYGDGVFFTATVARPTGSGSPTGSVQFKIDSVNFGAPVTLGAPTTSTSATAVSGSISTLTAGTHTVEAVYVPTGSFTTSADLLDGGQVVNKATPTATLAVSNSPQTYTGSGLAAAVNISVSSVPGAVANILTGGAATQAPAGTYAVTADFVPTDTANYTSLLGLAAGNFVIDKADATIVVTGYDVTYNGMAHTATGTATGAGGEDLSALLVLTGTTHTSAGNYPSDPWSFPGDANHNPDSGTVADNIDKADATIVVTGYDVTYNGMAHTATGTATGADGEDLSGLLVLTGTTHTGAGNYPSDPWSFPGDANHNPDSGTVADNIDKADATIVVTGYDVTYNGMAHTATGTATGAGGEDLSGLLVLTGTTHTGAGNYPSDPWSFPGDANHNPDSGTVVDNIDKADATIVVTGYDVTYNGMAHTATGTATGAGGEDLSGLLVLTGTTHTGAGNYPSDPWSFPGDANHNPDSGTVADNIDKADATIVVTGYDVTYNGMAHTATGTATGADGEDLSGLLVLTGTTHTGAGNYPSDPWSFPGDANHNPDSGTVADNIDKADATVVVNPYDVTYDGNPHMATIGSITGVNGETGATVGTVDVSNTMHTNAGTYASDSWSFTGTANYNDIGPTPITNEIDQADANVSITPYSGPYDAAAHNLTGSVTGVVGDPTAIGSSLTFGTSYTDAGNHTGTWTFEGGTNYLDESGTAAITISQADANVSITPYSGTYDAAAHNLSGTVVGVAGDPAAVGSSLTFGTSYTDAGNHTGTWTFEGGTNYVDESGTAAITIGQADANVSITPYSGTYDAAAHNLTGSVTGVLGDPTAVGSSLTFGAGFTNVPGGMGTWNFEGGTNYLDESGSAAITIGKATATVTVTPYNVQWDGDPHTATYSIAGVGGETGATVGAVNVSNTTHTLVGTYASDYWFFTGTGNYNNFGNTTITDVITTGYCFNGFLSPIGGAVENVPSNGGSYADPVRAFKLGSTIPVKFILNAKSGSTCGAVVTTGVHTLQATYYSSVVDSDPPVDASPTDAATTGNQFRLTGTEWHFNLSTKGGGFKAGTWLLKATLQDGSVKTVWVTIKK